MSDFFTTQMAIPERSLTHRSLKQSAEIQTEQLAQRTNALVGIPLTQCRIASNLALNLPAAASGSDLGLVTGVAGTSFPIVTAGGVKNTSGSRSLGFLFNVPPNFDVGESLTLRLRAGMQTTIASGSCTATVAVYRSNGDGASSANLYTGSPLSMNGLAPANIDFVLQSSGSTPGHAMHCVVTIAYSDVATATAVIPAIFGITLLADLRG
jgi:hypothetical protein